MITCTKNYTKTKQKKTDRQNRRTNGKSKAIQTNSHKEAYTYTITKREKEGKNIFFLKKMKRATKSVDKSTNDNKL